MGAGRVEQALFPRVAVMVTIADALLILEAGRKAEFYGEEIQGGQGG